MIKLGGSLLSPSSEVLFDFGLAQKWHELLSGNADRFIINIGGGYLSRAYQKLAKVNGEMDADDIHRIGIAASNMNAELLRSSLSDLAYPRVVSYGLYEDLISAGLDFDWRGKKVLVTGPNHPGHSNDWNALRIALSLGINEVIDIKNVDGVYDRDPNKHEGAQRLSKLTWNEYLNIIGNPKEHVPGASYPVDPKAARDAQKAGARFCILGGALDNLKLLLEGKEFVGSIISDNA